MRSEGEEGKRRREREEGREGLLSTRRIHAIVALQHDRASTRSARFTRLINLSGTLSAHKSQPTTGIKTHKPPRRARAPTNPHLILLSRRRLTRIQPTALPMAIEQIVIPTAIIHEAAFLRMGPARVIRHLDRSITAMARRARHRHLVQIAPEAAKRHLITPVAQRQEVRIDRIVRLPRGARHADGAVVRPRPDVHSGGSSDADGRGLRAEGRDGVVQVVGRPDLVDVRGPEVVVAGELD